MEVSASSSSGTNKDKFMLRCEWIFKNVLLNKLDDCKLKSPDEKKFEPKLSLFPAILFQQHHQSRLRNVVKKM